MEDTSKKQKNQKNLFLGNFCYLFLLEKLSPEPSWQKHWINHLEKQEVAAHWNCTLQRLVQRPEPQQILSCFVGIKTHGAALSPYVLVGSLVNRIENGHSRLWLTIHSEAKHCHKWGRLHLLQKPRQAVWQYWRLSQLLSFN